MRNSRTGEYRLRAENSMFLANRAPDQQERVCYLKWAIYWTRVAGMREAPDQIDEASELQRPPDFSDKQSI